MKKIFTSIIGIVFLNSMVLLTFGQTNLLQNGDFETQGVWKYNNWQSAAGNIVPTAIDFGYNTDKPLFGTGKCFHAAGTVDGSWHQVKVALWQPVLLHKGHVYKVAGAFKDNSATDYSNANSDGIWAEFHFYYKPPLTDSTPSPSKSLYYFNSWDDVRVNGMDGTFQDSSATKGYQLSASKGHPYYYVPDSIFASGKDTVTVYFACQFGMANGSTSEQIFDFTMDEFKVIDSLDLVVSVKSLSNNINELLNVSPNPAIGKINIAYSVPENGKVNLNLYNMLGQKVATLVNEYKNKGTYSIQYNGSSLTSGIYFGKLEVNGVASTKKLYFLK